MALGLLEDDTEWDRCLEEAVTYAMPKQLRQLFATILVYCQPTQPELLFNKYKGDMIEDFQGDENAVLHALDKILQTMSSSLNNFPTMPTSNTDFINDPIYHYNRADQLNIIHLLRRSLNQEKHMFTLCI